MSDDHIKIRRQPSESTREILRQRALTRGKSRSEDVARRVREVMKKVEDDIADNGGIYSKGAGALSSAEIARLAGIHPTTLFSAKQRELGGEIKKWLGELKKGNSVGTIRVRRTLKERIAAWKDLFEGLQQSHRDTELELQQAQADFVRVQTENQILKAENEELRTLINPRKNLTIIDFNKHKIIDRKSMHNLDDSE